MKLSANIMLILTEMVTLFETKTLIVLVLSAIDVPRIDIFKPFLSCRSNGVLPYNQLPLAHSMPVTDNSRSFYSFADQTWWMYVSVVQVKVASRNFD